MMRHEVLEAGFVALKQPYRPRVMVKVIGKFLQQDPLFLGHGHILNIMAAIEDFVAKHVVMDRGDFLFHIESQCRAVFPEKQASFAEIVQVERS